MLVDSYGREINYLRISVTENCNFRCQYCMPDTPIDMLHKENLLSVHELFTFIKIAIDNGIKKIRITGGEPTIRSDLPDLIRLIHEYDDSVDITLTSNGMLLCGMAQRLKDAGLKRINISLDSLQREKFKKITQKDALENVLRGIALCKELGLFVKINCVPIRGVNDDEVLDIFAFCHSRGLRLRFIEFMENSFANGGLRGLKGKEVLDIIKSRYEIKNEIKNTFGPATLFELVDGYVFGLIEPHRDDFCNDCNRLRLSAEGKIVPCLYFDEAIDAKETIKSGDIREIEKILRLAVKNKPEKNRWGIAEEGEKSNRAFYQTGG